MFFSGGGGWGLGTDEMANIFKIIKGQGDV